MGNSTSRDETTRTTTENERYHHDDMAAASTPIKGSDSDMVAPTVMMTSHLSSMTLSESSSVDTSSPTRTTNDNNKKVVIVSGGPLIQNYLSSLSLDDEKKKQADDASSVSEPSTLADTTTAASATQPAAVASSVSKTAVNVDYRVRNWCGTKYYSDLLQEGLDWIQQQKDPATATNAAASQRRVVMVYESPSQETKGTSFVNTTQFVFHDAPPGNPMPRTTLGPQRYATMTGSALPVYLKYEPEVALVEHWKEALPHFVEPTIVHDLDPAQDQISAYLPLESLHNMATTSITDNSPNHNHCHIQDPQVHYHLAGKDVIPLMTSQTTRLLANTKDVRPCIAKVNHSMGSRGIFVIRNDADEREFQDWLAVTGNPPYVVSDFIEIERNIAAHFFIHPSGDVLWLGNSENCPDGHGGWSADSTMNMLQQDELQSLQMSQVRDVADYCVSLGFWGFCGIDVLIEKGTGIGHVVDVNPRVTGTCPALMAHKKIRQEFGLDYGLFRRSTDHAFPGSAKDLLAQVQAHNTKHCGKSRVVIFSMSQVRDDHTLLNIGVYGTSLDECEHYLNHFSRRFHQAKATYM